MAASTPEAVGEKYIYDDKELQVELLQKYRRDRRELLNYMLASSLFKTVKLPDGSYSLEDLDLDQVSVDYVLECAKKGEVLDLSESIRRTHQDANIPLATGAQFFLFTDPEYSGPPPERPPPIIVSTQASTPGSLSKGLSRLSIRSTPGATADLEIDDFSDEMEDDEDDGEEAESRRKLNDARDLVLGLPTFETGYSEDDLRETAYEALLVCVGAQGHLIAPPKVSPTEKEEKKKKGMFKRFGKGKKDKDSKTATPVPRLSGMAGLMELMRAQMEIGEAVDHRTRTALLHAASNRVGRKMDTLLVPLELLSAVPRTDFSDKRAYIRWEKRQLNMLEEGLINHPYVPLDRTGRQAQELKLVLSQVEEAENMPAPGGLAQHAEALRALRTVALDLAERAGRGDSTGDVCHWADGFHINVRLYEKLLNSVFDVLDEATFLDEVDEILDLLKSTWKLLGITQTLHDACYAWVIFRQFVLTDDDQLLKVAVDQLKRIASESSRSIQERSYLRQLRCHSDNGTSVTYIEAVLSPIKAWCDKRLSDYHLNFPEGGQGRMELLLTVALVSGRLIAEESDQTQATRLASERGALAQSTEDYVRSSVKAAYSRAYDGCVKKAEAQRLHPLAVLANEIKVIAKSEESDYRGVLSKWNPDTVPLAVVILHGFYRTELKPFLDSVSQLTEDVATVLPAADGLEQFLIELLNKTAEDGRAHIFQEKLVPYEVEVVSGTLIMRWVNVQLAKLSEWVERSLYTETWDPVSAQLRYANSVVDVFRIIEETMDQFFGMNLPMRMNLLKPMLSGVDNALQLYSTRIISALGPLEDLIPPVPALTRYKKDIATKLVAAGKKKDPRLPDERRSTEIHALTTGKLCIRLNTLHYITGHLDQVEDHVKEQWNTRAGSGSTASVARQLSKNRSGSIKGNAADEIAASFEGSRKVVNTSIDKVCRFLGTKVIFWDEREVFIEGLYKTSVAQSRMEKVIADLDPVLAQMCDVISPSLRDRVVLALLQASLDGLLRVLLDGGPMRVFAPTDSDMLEEDINALKDFFVAEGDGLPRGVVENTANPVAKILTLYTLDTNVIVENFKQASEQMVAAHDSTSTHKSSARSATDADTLLRILCHRADREASKYLKKSYRLPKS